MAASCASYVMGLHDFHDLVGAQHWCLPPGVTASQLGSVFTKRLKDHPEELHKDAAWIALQAFKKAFPCKQ